MACLAASLLCLAGAVFPAAAHFPTAADLHQPSPEQQVQISAHAAQRSLIVSAYMKLSPSEAEAFWPLYEQYEAKMDQIDHRYVGEIRGYATHGERLNGEAAAHRLDELISTLQARLDVQKWYIAKFRAAMSPATVTRFFEIDDRVRTILLYKLASMEPPIKPAVPGRHSRVR
jgi:hypothetical protein